MTDLSQCRKCWRIFRRDLLLDGRCRRCRGELPEKVRSEPAPERRPTRKVTGGDWHRAKRDEQLRREWERWRYQRSLLPPEKRGKMMQVGERECRWCGDYFEPHTLRQRYCTDTCRKLAHKRRARARLPEPRRS